MTRLHPGAPSKFCTFHYEAGGKCHQTATRSWPDTELPFLCEEHYAIKARERDSFATTPKKAQFAQGGDWVSVYGQIPLKSERTHPDDVPVTFFSHNEEFTILVAADRVVKVDPPAHLASKCTSMYFATAAEHYIRCQYHSGHSGNHRKNGIEWSDGTAAGHIDPRDS